MPVQKDPSGRRFVAVEAEVPGTPEEVWQAIATGPGITAWFVPAKVDGRAKGSMVLTFGPGMESEGEIQAWDSLRRFTVENKEGMGPGSPTVTDEWTIEAKPGGTCRVRVVHAWSASGDEWNKHFESVEKGWPAFFLILKRYLARFRGQPCAQIQLMAFAPGPKDKTWAAITHPLGLVEANVGQSVTSSGDAPRLAAVVEHAEPQATADLVLRLEQPAPGSARLMAVSMGGQVCVSVQLYLYGNGAQDVAAREEPVWQAWLDRLFPAPVGQPGA